MAKFKGIFLENSMDGGAWWAAVHGVAKSRTQLSDFTFTFHFHALEKEMATHSSILAWRIPGMGEPGGLTSMGSHRVRHDWSDLAAAAEMQMERTLVDTVGEEEGGMKWKSSTDIYTIPCVKQKARGKRLDSTGNWARCSMTT